MFCVQNMGLSSKQVSGGGEAFDWVKNLMQGGSVLELPKMNQVRQKQPQQQQQQQLEPLKCPRCDSTNTKFCYYNNYNRSQPRHFCKSCRRHWTKGGTLRNVPVGGGRKNKRLKRSSAATTAATSASTDNSSRSNTGNVSINVPQQHLPVLGLGDDHEKNMSEILYKSLLLQPNTIRLADGISGSSTPSLDSLLPTPTFNISSSSTLPSISGCLGSTNYIVDYTGQAGASEYPATPPMMPWGSLMDSSSCYWNWEDLNYSLAPSDLKQPYMG